MPGQRRSAGSRSRGSWLPRLAGFGAIVVLAGGGTAAYLIAFHPAKPHHTVVLPRKVLGYQTVGIIGVPAEGGSASGKLVQLLSPEQGPTFTPVMPSEQVTGMPEWTADQMAGGTFIFIYLPTGSQCLASTGPARQPVVAVEHCDLGRPQQRWRRLSGSLKSNGHAFYQFENAASEKCLTQEPASGGLSVGVGLETCDPSRPMTQMLAFWWSSSG